MTCPDDPVTRPDADAADGFPADDRICDVLTHADGPAGALPIDAPTLRQWTSGDLFGLTQNAGMGWEPARVLGRDVLILSTLGGLRDDDGTPVALGYHTGHWEVGLLVREAAEELTRLGAIPFAGAVTDPCDGRTQGTRGMMDSLPYRNDAAVVFGRLIRSLPRRRGVIGVATCDKGLPAMLMALAACGDTPVVCVPGGVTLPPTRGEDAGKVQTLSARYAHGEITLREAAEMGCRACATPGGGCQFLGTAATSQVVAEAIGLTVPHAALAPSGQPVWLDLATRSARAVAGMIDAGIGARHLVTDAAVRNAIAAHAAFGGSTNLLLHIPAIAHAAGLDRPTVTDWLTINRAVPRLVDALPNGPVGHPTVRVYLAGGVPEVMSHLRDQGAIDDNALTASGRTWGDVLDRWVVSERRKRLRDRLHTADGVDPDDVILPPARAAEKGLTATVAFLTGNLAPHGAIMKATAIDPAAVDADGVYRHVGPARVFVTEHDAMTAVKDGRIVAGDVVVLVCRGPMGAGMEEIYQVTGALKHLPFGRHVAVVTDARFSGVSTGACVGHVGPEALAGGPVGKLLDGDRVRVTVNRRTLDGRVDLVGTRDGRTFDPAEGARVLSARDPRPDLAPDPHLPDATRLWAALQNAGGGTWGGCVYDVDAITRRLDAV